MLCRKYVVLLLAVLILLPLSAAAATEITVAAANSTCVTLKKAGEIFSRQQGVVIHYICKSSGALAKGLESGYITADYYISASQPWMEYMTAAGLIEAETVSTLWHNRIVAAAVTTSTVDLQGWEQLATDRISTVFVGDPSTTPLGRQFKNAMVARGLWPKIREKIVTKRHMSLTKDALVAANDTTIGILFPTSLDNRLKIVLDMPPEWHEPICYYAGSLLGSRNKEEITLFDAFLKSEAAREVFHQEGYLILP